MTKIGFLSPVTALYYRVIHFKKLSRGFLKRISATEGELPLQYLQKCCLMN